nr:ABC transporter permease subunit [Lachnospiraceae bacterium]
SYKLGWIHNDLLLPSPEGLFHVFVEKSSEITADVWGSVRLLFVGFILAAVFGTLLGLLAGWIPRVREVLLPISNVITLIPPLMFSAYLIMLLPTFRQAAIAVIFFAVFWPTFQGTVVRVGQIDRQIIEAAKTMGVGTFGMLVKVIFPYCLPGIISSLSKSLRGAFMCLAGAEMLGVNLGIGYFTEKYKSFADYRCVLAGIVTVGVITTVIDMAVNKAKNMIIKWEN